MPPNADLIVDRLILSASRATERARVCLRNDQRTEARIETRRARQCLELIAQARLCRAIALLETKQPNFSP